MTEVLGEFDVIARYFRPLAKDPAGFDLLDDAAVLTPMAGRDLVLTKDAIVAGVHFLADETPERVARKALRVNLSDLLAKGAQPIGYMLAIALPDDWTETALAAFAGGLEMDQDLFGVSLLGGDTVRTPGPLMVSITCFGQVPTGTMVRRGTAAPGDFVYVSGTIGDGALGLRAARAELPLGLSERHRQSLEDHYRVPDLPVGIAPLLRRHARAAMDISDGLIGDLDKMCAASGTGATIDHARVPVSEATRAALALDAGLQPLVLTGGDDYQVLASVPASAASAFESSCAAAGLPVTRIGEMRSAEHDVIVVDRVGQPLTLSDRGYVHL